MTLSGLKKHYSHFLKGHEGKLHFAAHSHHFWPDVTREAHLRYWDDCARTSDEKWDKIFSEVIPEARTHIAGILNLKNKEQIVFAPNTHELGARILSLFVGKASLNILTTSSEFHSWKRQLLRLMELPQVAATIVSTEHFLSDRRKVIDDLKEGLKAQPDIFFLSQVFFDSGLAFSDQELKDLSDACPKETIMVIDGYHGFAAIPTDLSGLEGKVFYLGGGYKYAQAGEGAAFLVVPEGKWRPTYTGWFAEFGSLSRPTGANVGYTNDGMAFMGATQDPSGLYRLNAVWNLFQELNLNVSEIHNYVKDLQTAFIQGLPDDFLKIHHLRPLFRELEWHGHFLTFEAATEDGAARTQDALKKANVLIDRRGRRLRFGFGLYQDLEDVSKLLSRLRILAK